MFSSSSSTLGMSKDDSPGVGDSQRAMLRQQPAGRREDQNQNQHPRGSRGEMKEEKQEVGARFFDQLVTLFFTLVCREMEKKNNLVDLALYNRQRTPLRKYDVFVYLCK